MRFRMHGFVVFAFAVLALTSAAFGQRTDATFAGIVTDPSGAVLPGVEVQMINEGTAAAMSQFTNETGEFVFTFIPAGTYTLKISMPGFKTYESRSMQLGAAQNVRRTYSLEVGALSDSVTVTGEAPQVNTLSPEQRISLELLEVKTLPMANRNLTNILEIGSGLTKGAPTNDGMAGTRYRLNGLGGSAMSVTANGSDANGASGSPNISGYGGYNKIDVMSSESVAEVQVIKGVMPAEYGGAMGGTMSVITKSGTNEWHGSLFHRYEGSVLSARSPIFSSEPNSVWNQFGGSIGGPIVRDKAFFFFAYEGYRQRTSIELTPTVPTPYFRSILEQSLPFPETKLLLNLYPLPNQPYEATDLLARWVGPGARINDDDHFDWKVDHLIAGGNFSLSFSGGHPYQSKASANPLDPQVFTTSSQRAAVNYVKAFGGGRWTSSTRAGYNRNWLQRVDDSWYLKDPVRPEKVPGWRRIKNISFPGMTSLRVENQTRGIIPSWQLEQQFAYFQGTHSWKFGGVLNLPSGGRPGTSNGSVTYQTLDDIRRNQPSQVNFTAGINPFRWRLVNFGMFIQDDWRVSKKLVLNLGLRYDRFGHFVPKAWHQDLPAALANFDGLLDPVAMTWGPLRPADNPFNSDPLSLGPRFGFAYTADDQGDFVVRGGFGVNFQGFDPQTYEVAVSRTPMLPNSKNYTRAEALARGLRFPVYNEDLAVLVEQEGGGQPQIGSRWNPNSKPPYAMNYTLGIQRALTSTLMLETAYVGTRGVKFNMARPYNQPDRITGIRPNRSDIGGNYTDQSQQTNYNSWQSTLKQRLTKGLLFGLHHTWGKGMSYVGGDVAPSFLGDTFGGVEDFDAVKIERSPSSGDVTHLLVANWVYNVPAFQANPIIQQVLGGWQISGIWKGRTGVPMRVTQTGGRPDIIDLPNAVNKCCSFGNLQYLNPAAFRLVPISSASARTIRRGSAGNAPVRGPGVTNLDLSLTKTFSIGERRQLELKADAMNALNQTQYRDVSTNMSSINFGQVTGTEAPRTIQIQLRLSF